jgi:uncharacterized membrane protein YeaQ/YmgE (transglycosylase-associated protein family)
MDTSSTLGTILVLLVTAAVVGVIVGALARLIVPGTAGFGVFKTIVVGFIGALAGGVIGNYLKWNNWGVLAVQVLIAALLVALLRPPKRY